MARFEATTSAEPGRVPVRPAGECDLAVSAQLVATPPAVVRRAPADDHAGAPDRSTCARRA